MIFRFFAVLSKLKSHPRQFAEEFRRLFHERFGDAQSARGEALSSMNTKRDSPCSWRSWVTHLFEISKTFLQPKEISTVMRNPDEKDSSEEECVRIDFDADFYLFLYPDVAKSGIDPLFHFVSYGRNEGRICCPPKIRVGNGRYFDPSKKTMLLVSHEASRSGAPILAFNLLEKFRERYNIISVLLGPGPLEEAFRNMGFDQTGWNPRKTSGY
jgi:hypothetical protein